MDTYCIGFITDNIDYQYQNRVWSGVLEEAKQSNVQIATFIGGRVHGDNDFEEQENVIYNIISEHRLDGLIFLSGAVFPCIEESEINAFIKTYKPLPMISIGAQIKGLHDISVDNTTGMFDIVSHLITLHGITSIAFVSGPRYNSEANLRLSAYKDALVTNNIIVDDDLIYYGNFETQSGIDAVKTLSDVNKKQFKAIVCANDEMAFGVIEELERRNIVIPYDIVVTGFDNVETSITVNPPLTTVEQPVYAMGRESLRMILKLIKGEKISNLKLNTHVVLRQSCGCLFEDSAAMVKEQAEHEELSSEGEKNVATSEDRDTTILKEYAILFLALQNECCDSKNNSEFLSLVDSLLRNEQNLTKIYPTLHKVHNELIRDIRIAVENYKNKKQHLHLFHKNNENELSMESYYYKEHLLHLAQRLVGEKMQQIELKEKLAADKDAFLVNQIGQSLMTTNETKDIFAVISSEFPRIHIDECHILFYTEDKINFPLTTHKIQIFQNTYTQY